MNPLTFRLVAIAILLFWFFCVRGRVINWVGFFKVLPGILLDVIIQIGLSIGDLFRRKKYWHPVNPHVTDEKDLYD
ncbi:MAG TPA: hypothetical protein VKQ52_17175 [Puia sp.]|nr:hypothetical protein [Puia sp.]